jgi:hypothetical protein
MKTHEAASLIQSILESMRGNPAQFNFNVSIRTVGAIGIGGAGGPGIVGIAQGGGIGFQVSASSPTTAQVQIAQQQANAEINAQAALALSALESIVKELESQSLTAAKRDGFVEQLKSTWLPNVVVTLVAEILKSALGG